MKFSDNNSECSMESDIYGEGLEPIKYTTINKLIKAGNINDKHIISNKLHPKIAKELYKNNIRIHPKHYINKDIPKYFHEEEIKGGRINFINSFKKFGSTVKHTFNDLGNKTKNFTMNSVNKVNDYANTVLNGRNDYQPKVRAIIKEYGDKKIKSIVADRTPVSNVLKGALNTASLGAFNKRLGRTNYDDLFHLRLDITFDNNQTIKVEKNEVINMDKNPIRKPNSEQHQINNLQPELTLNQMLIGAQKIQGNKYFLYSAFNNNCQDYIMALLRGANIGTEQDYNFIKQNTESLFKNDPFLRKLSNSVTDLGAKVNEITTGTGIENLSHKNISSNNDYNKMACCGFSKEKEIIKRIGDLSKDIHDHSSIHGGKINIARAFKKLGSTVKRGFENKIINPIEHKVINPLVHPVENIVDKTGDYVTAKKGGLASDLLHKGVPMATGYIAGSMAEALMPEAGPLAGYAGNKAGNYAGTKLADYIGDKTGTGIKTNRRGRKTSLEQLIENHKNKETKNLNKNLLEISNDALAEKRALRALSSRRYASGGKICACESESVKPTRKTKFVKGSIEAKEHMAKIRSMKK